MNLLAFSFFLAFLIYSVSSYVYKTNPILSRTLYSSDIDKRVHDIIKDKGWSHIKKEYLPLKDINEENKKHFFMLKLSIMYITIYTTIVYCNERRDFMKKCFLIMTMVVLTFLFPIIWEWILTEI